MRTLRRPSLWSGLIPLLGGFTLLAVIIAGTNWFLAVESRNREAGIHAYEFERGLYRLLSELQDAETGQRGYLLTGDDTYLAPYDHATSVIKPEFEDIGSIVAGRPDRIRQLNALRLLAIDKLDELKTTIDHYREHDTDAALRMVRGGAGQVLMDQIRKSIGQMIDAEHRIVIERRAEAERAGFWLRMSIALAGILLVGLATFNVLLSARQLRGAVESRDALRAANDQLVQEMVQRENVEEQLRQSQKMEVLGQLTGGLAHDFNNMLGIIIGSLNLLRRRQARGEHDFGRFIDAAMDGAQRAATLTQRLLAFSRQQPLAPQPVDINRFVGGMSELLRSTLGEQVHLETVLAGGLWRTHVDASQLENAILNLAVNARDAMPNGGRLTLETANCHLDDFYAARHAEVPAGQYVLLAVSDTGTGMPPDVIEKAFDPFFTTRAAGQGTGLGLSQVYGFVKQSSGHVKIYSEVGHGTTVKLYLPRFFGVTEPTTRRVDTDQALPISEAHEIILVVEDDERVRQLTVESLRELGYTVLDADGAVNALRILDSQPDVTLLFTDVVMPEVNGRKLADEAFRRFPGLKVLFTTGYTRNAIVHNGVLDPNVHFVPKPFTLEQLAFKVREVLQANA